MSTPVPRLTQNDPPLSAVLSVRVRWGGDVGVAEPQAAAGGAPVPDDPVAAEPAACSPHAAVSADSPMTAAAARNETLRMHTSQSQRATAVRSGAPAKVRRRALRLRSTDMRSGARNLF